MSSARARFASSVPDGSCLLADGDMYGRDKEGEKTMIMIIMMNMKTMMMIMKMKMMVMTMMMIEIDGGKNESKNNKSERQHDSGTNIEGLELE